MTRIPNSFPAVTFIAALFAALALSGCDRGSAQRDFEVEASQPPQGYTETDESGNLIGDPDPDDWRTAPLFPGVIVNPAFPNPVPPGFTGEVQVDVIVPFTSSIAGGIDLLIYDPRPPQPRTGLLTRIPPDELFEINSLRFTRGSVQIALTVPDASGFYRLFVQDGAGRLISYGDLCVNDYPCESF